jgi:hypothetical protein
MTSSTGFESGLPTPEVIVLMTVDAFRDIPLDSMPIALDLKIPFATYDFARANPQVADVRYKGPTDHFADLGGGAPTQVLQCDFRNGDFKRTLQIKDYRGKSGYKPFEDLAISYWGEDGEKYPFYASIHDAPYIPKDEVWGIKGLPAEFDIFASLHVAVFLKTMRYQALGGQRGLTFQYNTSPDAESLLRRMVMDMAGLDFSKSPLMPLRNLTGIEAARLGKYPLDVYAREAIVLRNTWNED